MSSPSSLDRLHDSPFRRLIRSSSMELNPELELLFLGLTLVLELAFVFLFLGGGFIVGNVDKPASWVCVAGKRIVLWPNPCLLYVLETFFLAGLRLVKFRPGGVGLLGLVMMDDMSDVFSLL